MTDHRSGSDGGTSGQAPAAPSRYVPVGRAYVHDGLGLSDVWRLLWDQHPEFLGSEGKSVRRFDGFMERVPASWQRFVRTSAGAWRYVRGRRRKNGSVDRALALPVAGEVAIVRRSGAVKVLDAKRGRVVTLMEGEAAAGKLRERLASARAVEAYPFAPRVLEASLDEGWFAEEFMRGTHPTAFRGCIDGFGDVYLPLLVAFARAEPPVGRKLGDYAADLAAEVLAPEGLLARLPAADREAVTSFVVELRDRLTEERVARERVPLTLSHGDFFSGNLVARADGPPRAIDWAHLGRRSPLYDLYYVVMNHCVKVLPEGRRQARIAELVSDFRRALKAEDPERFHELEAALSVRDEFRRLFYLECVQVPLRFCDDPTDRYVRAMVTRVAWFRAFESAIGAPT